MGGLDFKPKLAPETIAKETLQRCKIDKFPVEPEDICRKLGIFFQEDRLNKSKEGCSFKEDGKYGILINNRVKNERRKKFTFAHEIGHIQLNHLKDIKYIMCLSEDIENYKTDKTKEAEANRFASELILPSSEIIKHIKKSDINFDLIEEISMSYGASFTATAVKVVELSDLPCILVMSKDKKIEWFIASQDVKYKYDVPKSDLPEFTMAMELFNNPKTYKLEGKIETVEWLDDGDDDVDKLGIIHEHSLYYPNYNRVLTLLVLPDVAYGEMTL